MKKVLIVSAANFDINPLSLSLSDSGYDVYEAESKQEALSIFLSNRDITLVVMDIAIDTVSKSDCVTLVASLISDGYGGKFVVVTHTMEWKKLTDAIKAIEVATSPVDAIPMCCTLLRP